MVLRFAVAGASAFACVLTALSVGTQFWYSFTLTSPPANANTVQTTSIETVWGLFEQCVDGACESLFSGNAFNSNGCTHTAFDIQLRLAVIIGCMVGAAFFALITVPLSILNHKAICIIRMITALFVWLGIGVAVALYWQYLNSWLYCDATLCDHFTAQGLTCEDSYGWSFWVGVIAGFVAFAAWILSIVAIGGADDPNASSDDASKKGEPAADDDNKAPTNQGQEKPATASANEPAHDSADNSNQQQQSSSRAIAIQEETQQEDEIPEGFTGERNGVKYVNGEDMTGWELDEPTGYWWSDEAEVYWDPATGWYYDGYNDLWTDDSVTWKRYNDEGELVPVEQ